MSEFKILTDREHILTRPGMYAGSISATEIEVFHEKQWKTLKIIPAMVKIVSEIIDNSVDEYIRTSGKHGNRIEVSIERDFMGGSPEVSVKDNGRGIPVEKYQGEWKPVLAWTRARAGTNFTDDRQTIGANGVGSFLTAVFSREFTGRSVANGKSCSVTISKNAEKVVHFVDTTKEASGVSVRFCPDTSRFNWDPDMIDDLITYFDYRCEQLAVAYLGLDVTFNGKRFKFTNTNKMQDLFGDHAKIYSGDNVVAVFSPSDGAGFRFVSCVNGLDARLGGSPVDSLSALVANEIRDRVKKAHKIDVLPAQIKNHMFMALYMRGVENLQFDSQTKERITNNQKEFVPFFDTLNIQKIARDLVSDDDFIKPVIDSILLKQKLAEQRLLSAQQKKIAKKRVANHIKAESPNSDDKILFITEGESAAGQLLTVRNTKIHGGYSLRGKVMNTHGMAPTDIIKNKELSELMSILGLEFGKPSHRPDYGKIAVMVDADTDGLSILCLLVNFFSNWKELFSDGRIYHLRTPIVIAKKGKQVKRFYDLQEYRDQQSSLKGWETKYFKGLGSLNEEEYRLAIHEPYMVRITLDDMEKLNMAFGDSAQARKDWLLG